MWCFLLLFVLLIVWSHVLWLSLNVEEIHLPIALKFFKYFLNVEVVQSGSQGSTKAVQISAGMTTLASVQLKKGESVSAIQGDITQLRVDVIVNAANNRMDHIGGLARDIVEKGLSSLPYL